MKDLNDKTEENTNDNYCISDKNVFIFTRYKTDKTYGKQILMFQMNYLK